MPSSIPPALCADQASISYNFKTVSRVDDIGNVLSQVPVDVKSTLDHNPLAANVDKIDSFCPTSNGEESKIEIIGVGGIQNSETISVSTTPNGANSHNSHLTITIDSSDDEAEVNLTIPDKKENAKKPKRETSVQNMTSKLQTVPSDIKGPITPSNISSNSRGVGVVSRNAKNLAFTTQKGTLPLPAAFPIKNAMGSMSMKSSPNMAMKRESPSASDMPTKKAKIQQMEKTGSPIKIKIEIGKVPGSMASNAFSTNIAKSPNTNEVPMTVSPTQNTTKVNCDRTFASLVKLDYVPKVAPLPALTKEEVVELEITLQFGSNPDDDWRDDWSGNLQLIEKEIITNKDKMLTHPGVKPEVVPFRDWVAKKAKDGSADSFRGIKLLLSYIYNMKGTPAMAKKIMAYSLSRYAKSAEDRLEHIMEGIRRISYDPVVLQQDGWTALKSLKPDGASGGAFLIGRRVIWSRYEAIIIAFVRDDEIGDLWKAMWLEDLDTFDLEADELQEGLKKWEMRENRKKSKTVPSKAVKPFNGGIPVGRSSVDYIPKSGRPSTSSRFSATKDFTVEGIEQGIILASTLHPNARRGIFWPARVLHTSEVKAMGGSTSNSRRSYNKNLIPVIFLAPYWNGKYTSKGKGDFYDPSAAAAKNVYCTGNLFDMDTIEVSESTIQKYPYPGDSTSISIDSLRNQFRFLGLPKGAFPRFLDAHRLALALKSYAARQLSKNPSSKSDAHAFASLTDSHHLSVKTAIFPQSLLNLPYGYILAELPTPAEQASQLVGGEGEEVSEPLLQLHAIMKSMTPPYCWGKIQNTDKDTIDCSSPKGQTSMISTPQSVRPLTPIKSPEPRSLTSLSTPNTSGSSETKTSTWAVKNFASKYLLDLISEGSSNIPERPTSFSCLGDHLDILVRRLNQSSIALKTFSLDERRRELSALCSHCLIVKGHGEEALSSIDLPSSLNAKNLMMEWQKACERFYRTCVVEFSTPGFGNGVTAVVTDFRCNQHITANGSYERAVRLPAAIRGAKMAGAGVSPNIPLIYQVNDHYMELAEKKILPKAHNASYLKRMKARISALPVHVKGAPLTDDSDGEGGEDTMGSRGSFTAAVAAVAAALKGVDMVLHGEVVNVFCAVRPPGHHAGRDLRAMHAVSNGFCILNNAACAALYAATAISEGGCGLKRVCIIDFDVHHGNGTQDILCSTHDSRFLYVSLHAGGAHINGFEEADEELDSADNGYRRSLGGKSQEGIFPGRCGDTSPHAGVLNLPLGQKVTPSAIGNALVTHVAPAVEKFSPELIILSAGFDAHKHDPLGMGGLSAEDFGSVTEVACQMARSCSGRVLSLLEGGYGVPCCQVPKDIFVPKSLSSLQQNGAPPPQPRILKLGNDMPNSMEDDVPILLQQKLDKCYSEGFLHCVKEHVAALSNRNKHGNCGSIV